MNVNGYTYPPHQPSPQHQQQHQSQSQTQTLTQQQQQSPTGHTPQSGGINPAMLQAGPGAGAASHAQMQGMQGMTQAQQAQLLARQQMMSGMGGMNSMSSMGNMAGMGGMGGMGGMNAMSGMNGMGNMSNMGMGMPNGGMNLAMNNRMNNMGGMNVPGMPGMPSGGMGNMAGGMNSMNSIPGMNNINVDFLKSNMGGASASGMGGMNMDSGMTINPAMLGSSSSNGGGMNLSASAGAMSNQELQKMMAARQAALNMSGMAGMNSMNNLNNMAGVGGMGGMGMPGMNGMNMSMMGGNAQQQAMMQQYLAQHQAQQAQHQQQQQQSQSQSHPQAHSPHSTTQTTPASATGPGGNPYPPFPAQHQSQSQQMQIQNANVHSMPPPPPRPNTAMSTSSQHAMGIGIGRPPSAIHHQQHQQQQAAAMHNQQQQHAQQQMAGHGSISRPATASGFRPSSSAGEAPRTPHTPQLAHQQNQALSGMHSQGQSQHARELSQTPSRPQTAASNHAVGQPGMNGKYAPGIGSMGMNNMPGMPNMANMNNMSGMGGMGLMGGAGGGMMPPPTLPRQGSLGPASSSQGQSSMQPQAQAAQQMAHHQQQGMMSASHGHGSPMSASAPGSAGLTRTPSIGEGLSGMGVGMGGAGVGVDDPMGNMGNLAGMNSMNAGLGMSSGMSNAGMTAGLGMGMGIAGMGGVSGGIGMGAGVGGVGGIGVGPSGIGGMSQIQHMQEMQQRKAIALNEYHKQQAARLQQHQQQQAHQGQPQQQPGQPQSISAGPVGPSPGAPTIPSAGVGMSVEPQNLNMAQAHTSQMPGMNLGMGGAMGTPTRATSAVRASMPPPGSSAMSMGGVAPLTGASSGVSAGAVAPPATTSSGTSHTPSINGAIPPAQATNATATTSTVPNAQNALAASLPPLPAGVQLNSATTRVTIVPISEAGKKIPLLSQEEMEKVAGWLKMDKEYEQRFRQMVARAKAELAVGPAGVQRPRWWERDTNPAAVAAAAARRGKVEKFDLVYPHGTPQHREAAAAAARRKGRRREGLKIPGRLKPVDAEKGEQLVPIRLEFDVEHHKYRDTFVWNLNDPIVTPEAFAQSLIDDYGLSTSYYPIITKSIQEQLSDYRAHTATFADVSNDIDLTSSGEPTAPPIRGALEDESEDAKWWASWRAKLRKKDGTVKKNALLKEVAVAVAKAERSRKRKREAKESSAKESAAKEAGPANVEETKPPVAAPTATAPTDAVEKVNIQANTNVDVEMHEADEDDVHEELRIIIKLDITVGEMKLDDQFEWDIENSDPTPEQFAEVYCCDLGLAGEFKTAIAHSIREQVTSYQKSLFLVGHPSDGSAIQDDDLRMSFLPTVAPAARSVDQTQAHQPIINYLSDGELDRLDKDREKEANKRRKRNTRGRRGIALPDREPIRTHRTPAIGFPEIDPSTLAIAAAAAAPTSRRAAAAAASVTIANMVASENGTTILPPVSTTPSAPALPVSKIPKPRGSFKAPSYPSSILKPRANVTSPTPSTVVDTAAFEPPIEGDAPLPPSAPATPTAPPSKVNQGPMTAKRQRELEKEAKEREFADGQRANMINGVWHCSNCGCPDSVAIGRRKGPLGDKSQCGACGKFWHRHRRPRPVEYHTDPEYHLNLKMESERAKASAKKRGGAAALRALNLQQQDQAATPTDEPSSPHIPKNEVWVEIKSPRKSARSTPVSADILDLDRPLSPASDVSSDSSEKPLAQSAGRANGTTSASKPVSTVATPSKNPSELPSQPEASTSALAPSSPSSKPNSTLPNKDSTPSEPASAPALSSTPSQEPSAAQGTPPPRPVRPQWQETAMTEMRTRYSEDQFDIILRKQNNGNPPEWRVKCLDCPGKLYTPGPGETLSNFEVHLKNRQHRAKVQARLQGSAN